MKRPLVSLLMTVLLLTVAAIGGCGNNNSRGANNSVNNGDDNVAAQPRGRGTRPSEMADWPPMPEGSGSGTMSGGIIGDVLGRMPPALGAADGLLKPGETAEIKIVLGRGLGSVQYRGYADETVIVRDAHSGDEVYRGQTDDDGRLTFRRRFPHVGNYFFEARAADEVDGAEVKPALFGIYVRQADAPFVVSDIDKTLVESGFARVLLGMAEPFDNAENVLQRLVDEREWSVIYLTQRPDYLEPLSKNWLRKHGFPPGPVVPTNLETLIQGSGRFKTGAVRDLKERFPNIKLAIGDKYSDSKAYTSNDVKSILIPPVDWDEDDSEYWDEQIQQLQQVEDEVEVVQDWHEIEQAIFGNKRYPPRNMLNMMRQQR